MHKIETGLYLINTIQSSALYKGRAFAILNSVGKIPWDMDILRINTRGSVISDKLSWRILAVTSLCPGAELRRFLIMLPISKDVNVNDATNIDFINLFSSYWLGYLYWLGIFPTCLGPMQMKKTLNLSLMIHLSPVEIIKKFLQLFCLFLPMISFIMDHIFLILALLVFNMSEWYFFSNWVKFALSYSYTACIVFHYKNSKLMNTMIEKIYVIISCQVSYLIFPYNSIH